VPESPLQDVASCQLDSSGTDIDTYGPIPAGQTHKVERFSASGPSTSSSAVLKVYKGLSATGVNYLDGTNSASFDVAEYPNPIRLYPGETLFFSWTGGSAGDSMTCAIYGLIEG